MYKKGTLDITFFLYFYIKRRDKQIVRHVMIIFAFTHECVYNISLSTGYFTSLYLNTANKACILFQFDIHIYFQDKVIIYHYIWSQYKCAQRMKYNNKSGNNLNRRNRKSHIRHGSKNR